MGRDESDFELSQGQADDRILGYDSDMKINFSIRACAMLIALALMTISARGEDPKPIAIDAKDTAALKAAIGKRVVVSGHVWSAQWSSSGKVLNIEFSGAGEAGFVAVAFDKNRKALDATFGGDVAKALMDKDVQLRGQLEESRAKTKQYAGRPQIVITEPGQITIQQPTTTPAS
ncbi:MAG TPA: hypothetical protein PK402_03845 [Tepidisphaeraceae bacterium]|nr:hypothetical protein [Tepidisphaeraceae bacterium]